MVQLQGILINFIQWVNTVCGQEKSYHFNEIGFKPDVFFIYLFYLDGYRKRNLILKLWQQDHNDKVEI